MLKAILQSFKTQVLNWETSEEYTRQSLFIDEPVLYFNDEIAKSLGILSYQSNHTGIELSGDYCVTSKFLCKSNSAIRAMLYNCTNHFTVYDDGKKYKSLYIYYNKVYSYEDYEVPFVDYAFTIRDTTVYINSLLLDCSHFENCNIIMNVANFFHNNLKSVCLHNNSVELEYLDCSDYDYAQLLELDSCSNLHIQNLGFSFRKAYYYSVGFADGSYDERQYKNCLDYASRHHSTTLYLQATMMGENNDLINYFRYTLNSECMNLSNLHILIYVIESSKPLSYYQSSDYSITDVIEMTSVSEKVYVYNSDSAKKYKDIYNSKYLKAW